MKQIVISLAAVVGLLVVGCTSETGTGDPTEGAPPVVEDGVSIKKQEGTNCVNAGGGTYYVCCTTIPGWGLVNYIIEDGVTTSTKYYKGESCPGAN